MEINKIFFNIFRVLLVIVFAVLLFFVVTSIASCNNSNIKVSTINSQKKDSTQNENSKSGQKVVIFDSSYGGDALIIDSVYANPKYYSKEYKGYSSYLQFLNKEKEILENQSKVKTYQLPKNAKIIEYVKLKNYKNRAIILWMIDPRVFIGMDESYTCPEVTMGKGYFIGITKISLLNTKGKSIINTLDISGGCDYEYRDTLKKVMAMDIPFSIRNPKVTQTIGGFKYHAIGGTDSTDGKAQLIYLEDFNGDGKKLEFAFYIQDGCMSCNTSLFGYSTSPDKIINYEIKLKVLGTNFNRDSTFTDTTYETSSKWIDHAFCFKFNKKGKLDFDMDYRGRGGSWDRYHLKYNTVGEYFSGILNSRPQKGDDSLPYSWYDLPQKH